MRQETVSVYKFEELPENIQQKLIDKYRYVEAEYNDWYEFKSDEIERLGGNLIEFDIYRGTIRIEIDYPIDFAKAIMANHGKECDTYILSEDFINGELSGKEYAWLGVSTTDMTKQLREYFNAPQDLGVLVKEVLEDSPAEEYGLKAGDIIVRIDQRDIEDRYDLKHTIDYFEPDDEVEIEIIRDRQPKCLKIKLGTRKDFSDRFLVLEPEDFEWYIPEIDIELPEIDIEIPEFDREEIDELHDKLRDEIKIETDEIKKQMKELKDQFKDIKFRVNTRNRTII